ncbi:hypothetical protein ABC955_08505 [Citromicrobium bathyomarinum]
MLLSLILALAQPVPGADTGPSTASAAPDCSYDLDAMLALDRDAFDQDMDGGWRALAKKEGCELAAAELIREWRYAKRAHDSILYWHEGQMRAYAGQTDQAIALFRITYHPPEEDADFGWNHYVSGTIAFLARDRDGLRRSIEGLKQVPDSDQRHVTAADGTVFEISWPPNLNVLEAMERCWDRPYREAYSAAACRAPDGVS